VKFQCGHFQLFDESTSVRIDLINVKCPACG
jgi:hypothetical protein